MSAGTTVMIMKTGMKHTMIGKIILTVSLAAFSSVRCLRLSRISADWIRSVSAMGTPCFWACSSAVTSWRISRICARSASARSAWARGTPAWMSLIVWRSSSVNGPSVVVATRASAASKPRPASTQMVSWSMVSAASAWIATWRLSRTLTTQ